MNRLRTLAAWTILATLIAGCSSLGLAPAQSLNQKIAYAVGQHTAVLQATTTAVQSGALSSTDAEQVLKMADQSKTILDAAVSLSASGDVTGATNKLALATAALTALQTFLNAHGGGH
jgi:hypothetical protein